MEAKRQNRNTLLFVGFFLLAGILHVVENHCHNLPSPDYSAVTILFLVIFMIYTALLIFWIQSVRIRFLPSRERSYMIWIMLLMILYLCLRVFRYRIASSAAALRLSWYAYYVPLMLVPALFLYGGNPVRYTFVRKRCQEQEKNLKKKRIWIYMADGASVLPEDSIFLMDKNTVFERAEATGEWLFTAIGVESRKQDQEADMTGMENNDNKKVAMRVRSLPEAFPVVGKRLEDLGFTREDLESEMYLLIETEFLGEMTEIMGLTEMWNDNLIKELTFYSEQHFDEAKAYFTDLYGEPFRKGWEPYAMSHGGVVDWFMYWTGEGIVQLRKGRDFNWFECKYEIPKEKPAEILKQEQGLTLQEFAWSSGYYMNDLTEEDFDHLKIEKKEEDHLTWDFIYQGTECHFDLYRKKGPQLADYMSGVSYETSRVGDWEEVHTCVKDGWGEQIWVNPVNDIWRLEIRKEATAEKLNAIRELLETHSWRYDPSKKE